MQRTLLLVSFFISVTTLSLSATAEEIKPFTTDGCSVFPDGNLIDNKKWLNCCVSHDFAYWKGGTYDERKEADEALKQCVIGIGEPELAELMYLGVRMGGSPYFPTWYRWGYGWPYLRGYEPLTAEEESDIEKQSRRFQQSSGN